MVRLAKALPVKRQGMAFTFFSLPIFSPYPVFLCRPCRLGRLPRWGCSGTGTGTGTTLSTPGAEPSVRGAPVPSRPSRAPSRGPPSASRGAETPSGCRAGLWGRGGRCGSVCRGLEALLVHGARLCSRSCYRAVIQTVFHFSIIIIIFP